MEITAQYGGQLADAAGCHQETVNLEPAERLSALLRLLADRHGPGISRLVFRPDGQAQLSLLAAVDDRQVDKGDDPVLTNARTVMLLTPMAGG